MMSPMMLYDQPSAFPPRESKRERKEETHTTTGSQTSEAVEKSQKDPGSSSSNRRDIMLEKCSNKEYMYMYILYKCIYLIQ